MPTIESRVVEMRFDNKQFEDNAQQSMKTVDKLNKSLNFDKTSKSIDKLADAGKKFSLKNMEVALQTVTEKFSAMEIAGMTVVANLTDRFTNMGINFVKSMTTDLIGSGFDKYAQKTSAIQTIMSATAKDWDDQSAQMAYVNEQMEKLSWFTDETSYSLLDMTNNIGKFTSNGIKLEDAVNQMQGISVWASLSGASISDAGRAMYNLSQAMASGSVKSIDWMSIENANMATREFKEAAIAAAVELGTLKKTSDGYTTSAGKAVDVTKDFKGTLSTGWFTSDVLAKTLNNFGDFTTALYDFEDAAQLDSASEAIKMLDEYEAASGDAAEQQKLLTKYSNQTTLSVDELKKHLDKLSSSEMDMGKRAFKAAQEAKTFQEAVDATSEAVASGWMKTFEYIFGDYLHAKKLWTNLSEELYELFVTPLNIQNDILKLWAGDQEKGSGYATFIEGIENLVAGIKTIGGSVSDAFNMVFDPFYNLVETGEDIAARADWLIDLTNKFKDFTERFKNYFQEIEEVAEEATEPVKETVETVTEVVDTIAKTQEVLDDLAMQTIRGDFGNGQERIDTLRELGYSFELVQNRVNELLGVDYRYEVETEKVVEKTEAVTETVSKTADAFREQSMDVSDAAETAGTVLSKTASQFEEFSDVTHGTTKELTPAQERLEILHSLFIDIFQVLKWGKLILEGIGRVVGHVFGIVLGAIEGPLWSGLKTITDAFELLWETFDVDSAITGFFDSFINAIDLVVGAISRFFNLLKNDIGVIRLIGSLTRLRDMFFELIGKVFDKLNQKATTIDWALTLDTALDILAEAISFVADKLAEAIDFVVSHKEDIENFFSVFGQGLVDAIGGVAGALGGFYEAVKNGDAIQVPDILAWFDNLDFSVFNNIVEWLKGIGDKIGDMLSNFDPGRMGKMMAGGGLAAIGVAIWNFASSLANGAKELAKLPKNLNGLITGFMQSVKAEANDKNANAVLKIAKAIGILAASMFALSFVDADKLHLVSSALIVIMGLVAVILNVIAKMKAAKTDDSSFIDKLLEPFKSFMDKTSKTLEDTAKIAKISMGIVAFVAAIGLLALIGNALSKINWITFIDGALKVTILGGLLVGAAVALSKFAENLDFDMASGLIAFAAAIAILAMVTKSLAKLNPVELATGLTGVATLMAALVAVSLVANEDGMTEFAKGALILSAAMLILALAVKAIGKLPAAQVAKGAGAIAGLAIVFGIVGAVMSKFEGAGDQLIKLAESLILLSIPLVVVGRYANEAGMGLLIIAGGLVALLAAGFAAQFVATGLEALGNAAQKIGIGAVLFGAGMALIAASIYLVGKAIPVVVDAFIYLGQQISEHTAELTNGIAALLVGIAGAIVSSAVPIATAVLYLILHIANQIVAAAPILTGQIFLLIANVLAFIISVLDQVVTMLIQVIIALINAVANGIRNNAQPLLEAVANLLDSIWDLIIELVASVVSMIPGVGGMLADGIRGAKDWVVPAAQDTTNAVNTELSKIGDVPGMADNVENNANLALANADTSSGTGAFTTNMMNGIVNPFTNGEYDSLLSGGIDGLMQNMIPNMENGGVQLSDSFISELSSGVTDGEDEVESAMNTTVDSATSSAGTHMTTGGESAGSYFNPGVLSGIMSNLHLAYQGGEASANEVERGYRNASLTKSPSRVGMMLGKFWDVGVAKGVDNNLSLVRKSGERSGYSLRDSLQNAINRVSEWVDSDMDINPRVTPVLDLSNVQNGMGMFDGMFGQRSMELAFAGANITTRDMRLSAEMDGIKTDISDLSRSIDNLAAAQENQTYEFVTNTNLDGRNIARATARYNRSELALLDRNTNRKGGKVR